MQAALRKNRLLRRMVLALLPASALPLLCFGYISIRSHYDSLRTQSLQNHKTMVTFMGRQLDADLAQAVQKVQAASRSEVFKTRNQFLMREALAGIKALSPEFVRVEFLAEDKKIVAGEPQEPQNEGKPFDDKLFGKADGDGLSVSRVYNSDMLVPRFGILQRVAGLADAHAGYFYAEVSLAGWAQISRTILRNHPAVLAALLPIRPEFEAIGLNEETGAAYWARVAAIRSLVTEATEQEIDGETHHVMFQDVDQLHMKLVVAQPISAIYASPKRVLSMYVAVIFALFLVLGGLIVFLARGVTGPIQQLVDAALAFSDGRLEVRAPVQGDDELALLAETFNKMGNSLQVSHQRMRVLYKSIMELFACNDVDNILRKAAELACTQCQGEVSWFLPNKHGHEVEYADDSIFVGLHGWVWKNHRSGEIGARESTGVWRRVEGDRIFSFMMKNQGQPIGVLKVAYRQAPDEHMVSLLHSLISLVEMALAKQELIRKGAMVSTELGMAEAVQRNIMSDNLLVSKSSRTAYHYQPASRLGGDWFFLIEDAKADSLYVIMGDVTGHGLAQGLVTTAVKGALDVIEHLLKQTDRGGIHGPGDIVTLLKTVVQRVAGPSELTMTCLAAQIDFKRQELKVCNAGHTFPILLRQEAGVNVASHLHKNQQPMLGPLDDGSHRYVDTAYDLRPDDLLIIYTDGLTEAKNLKSGIFGRFLFRSLRKPRDYSAADELKAEILEMFRYYTQNTRIDDDVCFLVVQMRNLEQAVASTDKSA